MVGNSTTDKTNLQWQKANEWLPRVGDRERMDSRKHKGTLGVVKMPCILTFVKSHGTVYKYWCALLYANYPAVFLMWKEKVGKESWRGFTILILYIFPLFEVWQWAFVTFTTKRFLWKEWGQGRGESPKHFLERGSWSCEIQPGLYS